MIAELSLEDESLVAAQGGGGFGAVVLVIAADRPAAVAGPVQESRRWSTPGVAEPHLAAGSEHLVKDVEQRVDICPVVGHVCCDNQRKLFVAGLTPIED